MSTLTSNDTLAEVFDVHPIIIQDIIKTNTSITTTESNVVNQLVPVSSTDAELESVRGTLHDLIGKGSGAIDNVLAVAKESQHPRAYEVAGLLIKNVGELADKLINLQKAKAELSVKEDGPRSVNIDKAVFVGSTADLLKSIKKNND